MSALLKLSALAVRGFVFGACQAIGLEAGEKAVEPLARFLGERFGQRGDKLELALARANDRAWDALECALAGESLWQRCTSLFHRTSDRAFRAQVRGFLDSLPPAMLDGHAPEFRKLALNELRLARREGALRVSTLDVQQLAYHAGRFAAFVNPQALLAAEKQALGEIAACFPGDRYAHLRKILEETPLLPVAARYFLRREIEGDRELFHGLTYTLVEQQGCALEAGLTQLHDLLQGHANELAQLLTDVVQLANWTHDEVLQISAKLDQLLARHQLADRELRPEDTLLPVHETEHRLVRQLVQAYRALPEAEKSERLELGYKIGQAEALSGDYASAQREFEVAARLLPEPTRKAEAHASALQAALAQGDLDAGFTSLCAAAKLDPPRFAPFPLDKYLPERILGAGGFGCAVLCRHAFQRTQVVVKTLWTTGLERAIDDVFHEARVLAGLHHPAIVEVLDCDYADRERRLRPFLVMDYFAGTSLAAHVAERGPLAPVDFLPLARQLAQGLHAAHAHGIYHRDVKPANVLISVRPDPTPSPVEAKLIDFGLALRPSTLSVTRNTLVGHSIAGTWKYAAPEQLGDIPGVAIGAYSDVHAFGRTCYFALLGTPEPDDEEKERLPQAWRRLLSRCTARMPGRRLQNFAEVLEELDHLNLPQPKSIAPSHPTRPARPQFARTGNADATCIRTVAAHDSTVSSLTFRPDGKLLATGGFDDRVRIWSLPSGGLLHSIDAHRADVNGVAFHPTGHQLASASDDHNVHLWSVPHGRLISTLHHPEQVYGVGFSPDGGLLATGCDDGKVRLWSPATSSRMPLQTLSAHSGYVRHVVFSPDGQRLASASADRLVHLWNVKDGRRQVSLAGHVHAIWGVTFSPDGKLLATASQDKTARIWQVGESHSLFTLEGHQDTVWAVAFSPDGRLVATASHDRTVKLWCLLNGRLITTLAGHTGLVRSVAFSPDGRMLATASGDGSIRLWLLHDETERCDWTVSVPDLPPRPRVQLTMAGNGVVYPGDEYWLDVLVENQGRGDLVQLRSQVESASPLLRGLHAFYGRVAPGEKVHRCVSLVVPTEARPAELHGEVVFHEANDYQPATVPFTVQVRALPREDFHVSWRLVDDGSGNSFGDGDGKPNRGECIDVVSLVENQTGGDLEGLQLSLVALEAPAGVVVNVPTTELPRVMHGGIVEGRVTFSVKPAAKTGAARFELRVLTRDGRVLAREAIATEIA